MKATGNFRLMPGEELTKTFKINILFLSNFPKILFCTLSLLVRRTEKGKVAPTARMPSGLRLRDEGQERQEAKTRDDKDDTPGGVLKGNGTASRMIPLKDKQG